MPGARLLQITTPFAILEVHGPLQSRWGVVRTFPDSDVTHLSVESTAGPVKAKWTDVNGALHDWPDEPGGPLLFEDTTYRLRAKSLVYGRVPIVQNRDPNLLRDVDIYLDDLTIAGPINFRRQVGYSLLEVQVANDTLRVTVEVFPAKLDYERDYRTLLYRVASVARGLALEYLRATYRKGTGKEADETTGLEWLTLLRNEIDSLDSSLRYVNRHPQRVLSSEIGFVQPEKIKNVDSSVRRAILRGQGRGAWIGMPGVGRVRSAIPTVRTNETLNTPEHQWMILQLRLIRDRIADLHAAVAAEARRFGHSNRPIPNRLQAEETEIAKFVGIVERLLDLPVFQGVTDTPPPGFSSLALLGGTGYGDAYRAIMVIRLGLGIEGGSFDLSVMDVHELYESWCFIEIVSLICSMIGGPAEIGDLIQVEESGIRVRLRRGERSAVSRKEAGRTVTVSYNPAFTGLTGDQRPDIVLRFDQEGWPCLFVVLDAKYRLDASDEYRQKFGTLGPPQEAINALHRYRDAIVLESAERGLQRPVVKGAALFPLSVGESEEFPASQLNRALEVLGIGALPFLPGNTNLVEAWLRHILELAPDSLAEPGPPFAGLSEIWRRSLEG